MSWPIAAALVIGLVLLILVGGVAVARRAQSDDASQVAVTAPERTAARPVAVANATAFTAATSAAATATPQVATPVTTALERSTPVASGTRAPGVGATPAATNPVTFSVVTENGTPRVVAGGAPVATPTEWWNQSNTISPELADQLNAAYQRFWDVRAQALLDLDPSALPSVLDGAALQREQANLETLRAQNQAEQIDVQHHMQIVHATPEDATILDNYTSRVIPVDVSTSEPRTPSPSTSWFLAYHFRNLGGSWKVVEAVQIDT